MRVLYSSQPLEDVPTLLVAFRTRQPPIQPRGVHLVSIVIRPARFNRHAGIVAVARDKPKR
jgi:hypothetical protein